MTEAAPVFDLDPWGHLHPNTSFIHYWSISAQVKKIQQSYLLNILIPL